MRILVTCPPMLQAISSFERDFLAEGFDVTAPDVEQYLSHDELLKMVPKHHGWIAGDDPATRDLIRTSRLGSLRAIVKWGIGIDSVDVRACEEFGVKFANTPNMFGNEVADLALGYVIALARETFQIDRGVRAGLWPKPTGISLSGKTAAVVGFGDVGRRVSSRLLCLGMEVVAYDPYSPVDESLPAVMRANWPERIEEADFVVLTCPLTVETRHLLGRAVFHRLKNGVRIVNVSRGSVIDEPALEEALKRGKVYSVALDVFEEEPLPTSSYLRKHPRSILGSHNGSNTVEAVNRTSRLAIATIAGFLRDRA